MGEGGVRPYLVGQDGGPTGSQSDSQSAVARFATSCGCCCAALLHWLLFAFITPREKFSSKVRKAALCVGFVSGFTGGTVSVFGLFFTAYNDPTRLDRVVPSAIVALAMLFPIVYYLRFRCTRVASDTLLWLLMLTWIICNVAADLSVVGQFGPCISSVIGIIALATEMSHGWIVAATTLVIAVLCNANSVFRWTTQLMDDTPSPQSTIIVFLGFLLVYTYFYYFLKEYNASVARLHKSMLRARLASRTAATLAESVAVYDTSAMEVTLAQYEAVPDCDRRILRSFKTIHANLKRYRPHLPNYMLRSSDDVDDEEGDAGVVNMVVSSREQASVSSSRRSSTLEYNSQASTSARQRIGTPAAAGEVPVAKARVISSEHLTHRNSADSEPCNPGTQQGALAASGHASVQVVSKHAGLAAVVLALPSILLSSTKVAMCKAVIVPFRWLNSTSPPSPSAASGGGQRDRSGGDAAPTYYLPEPILHCLLLYVQALAASTHGSIHSFIADELVVTWGATRRVIQPETKACRFAIGLHNAIRSVNDDPEAFCQWVRTVGQFLSTGGIRPPFRSGDDPRGVASTTSASAPLSIVAGIAVVAQAVAFSLFAGDDSQRTFLCSAPTLRERAHFLAQRALSVSTFTAMSGSPPTGAGVTILADAATHDVAAFHVVTRAVGVLTSDTAKFSAAVGTGVTPPAPPKATSRRDVQAAPSSSTTSGEGPTTHVLVESQPPRPIPNGGDDPHHRRSKAVLIYEIVATESAATSTAPADEWMYELHAAEKTDNHALTAIVLGIAEVLVVSDRDGGESFDDQPPAFVVVDYEKVGGSVRRRFEAVSLLLNAGCDPRHVHLALAGRKIPVGVVVSSRADKCLVAAINAALVALSALHDHQVSCAPCVMRFALELRLTLDECCC